MIKLKQHMPPPIQIMLPFLLHPLTFFSLRNDEIHSNFKAMFEQKVTSSKHFKIVFQQFLIKLIAIWQIFMNNVQAFQQQVLHKFILQQPTRIQ